MSNDFSFGFKKAFTPNTTPSELVFFDTSDPNTGGTVFDPNTPAQADTLYVSSVDASTWIYSGGAYVSYTPPATASTPFWLYGTTIDAGSNKTAFIQRNGPIFINSASSNGSRYATYIYSRAVTGQGNGLIVKKDLRTTSGNYLLVQGQNFSTGVTEDKLKVGHNGDLTINNAYTLPTSDGTSGQVMKTDGAGNVTWQSGSSSGIFGISDATGTYTYYSTLTLAIASAVSGDTIEQFADVTESGAVTITLKDGVNINGNGHTYTHTDGTVTSFNLSSDTTCRINNMYIRKTASTLSASVYVFNLASYNCTIDFSGTKVDMQITTPSSYVMFMQSGTCEVSNLYVTSNCSGIYSNNSNNIIQNCYVNTSNTAIDNSGVTRNCTGISSTGIGVKCGTSGTIYNSIGISSSNSGIASNTGAGLVVNSTGISTSGTGIYANTNNCVGISVSGTGIGGANSAIHRNSTGVSSTGYGLNSGASLYNCSLYSSGNYAGNGLASYYECTIFCNWNNASGHALSRPSEVLNCNVRVVNSSANCLYYSSAMTTNYSNNTFKGATTPVNANITQGITNTSDSQGNILV